MTVMPYSKKMGTCSESIVMGGIGLRSGFVITLVCSCCGPRGGAYQNGSLFSTNSYDLGFSSYEQELCKWQEVNETCKKCVRRRSSMTLEPSVEKGNGLPSVLLGVVGYRTLTHSLWQNYPGARQSS